MDRGGTVAEDMTPDGGSGRKEPEAHFVRGHYRDGKWRPGVIRGRGKPSLVFVTVLLALAIAAMSFRAGM
jgi:hypothetical protein